ncbi:MAG: trehalose-phosphatase [Jannaschia sp.]
MEGEAEPQTQGLILPDLNSSALFLDFDGTLVDIADRPDAVSVPDRVKRLLSRAQDRLSGRVAIVSGRAISDLRAFLPAFKGTMIGSHGAERLVDGIDEHVADFDTDRIAALQDLVFDFVRLQPDFLAERKPTGIVLHYRQAQEQGALALRFMESLAAAADGFRLQPAHFAYEIKLDSVGKDAAVSGMMARDTFAGSTPIYAGDDLTDEAALSWVQDQGGVAVKIGDAETVARHRLADPAELIGYLERWLA